MENQAHEIISLLDIEFTNMDMGQLLEAVLEQAKNRIKANLVFLNVDVVIKAERDTYLKKIIKESEYVLADGKPLVWISKLFGSPLKEKISGSDFVPALCGQAVKGDYSVFFVGGSTTAARLACQNLKNSYPGIKIAGNYSPPLGFENSPVETGKLNEAIRKARPDILIVCLGCPKQEKYIYENQDKYGVPISICAGATIDFLAGTVKRCPAWMSRNGLEWFYRFLQEPRRLFKRYFIDDVQILRLIFKYWKHKDRKSVCE